MEAEFHSDKIVFENHSDENYLSVGFSNNGDDPTEYVILQKALSFDKQDIALGMDTYYMEYAFGEDSLIGYGVCENILALEKSVIFQFKPNKFNINRLNINVEKQLDIYDSSSFRQIFEQIIRMDKRQFPV